MTIDLDKPVLIVPFGQFPHPGGLQLIDQAAVERIINQLSKWDRDIVVDYQHESFKECGRAPAAGWVKSKTATVTENGIEAVIEWTDEAREQIESRNYLYLSPVFEKENGVIARLFNLGLTNNPNIEAMAPLVNQSIKQEIHMEKQLEEETPVEETEQAVEVEESAPTLVSLLGDLVALLGLTPEADDEAVMSRIKELAEETASKHEGEI
jgi:phage I-like protein